MYASSPASFVYVFLSGIRLGIHEVVHECVVEKNRILRDDAELTAQTCNGNVAHVHAIYLDAAGINVVKPEEQFQDGGLATSALANDGGRCAGQHFETDAFEGMLSLVICEVDVLDRDSSCAMAQGARALFINDCRLFFELLHYV